MDTEEKARMIAAILTAGHIIDTKMKLEDIDETVGIYKRLEKVYRKHLEHEMEYPDAADQPEELEMISAILTSGYIVNTWHTEKLSEIIMKFEEFKDLYKNAEGRVPILHSERSINIAAAILIAGLIINTTDLEESPGDSTFLYAQCMKKLTGK